ncbi:MAG TPA: heliorhodopsin HeR [Candidatus Saccharimonadales bacterium]|nr:heliorhodopsin HeR [Candidatus Saccharimonadales bacterium]
MSKSSSRAKSKARTKVTLSKAKTTKSSAKTAEPITESAAVLEVPEKTRVLPGLQRWNVWAAALLVVQAVAILVLSNAHNVAVTVNYLTANPLDGGMVAAVRRLFDFNIGYLVTLFLLAAAVEYVLVTSVYRKQYEAELAEGINRIRWIHSAFVPSLVFLVVALLAGVYDLSSLLMIMVLSAVLHGLASFIELRNKGKKATDWATGRWAILAGLMPFIVFIVYAVSTSIYGGTHLLAYVYGLFGTLVLTFAGLGANYFLQRQGKGRWADYLFGERVYTIINVTAKTALAWQIFAGLLHP